MNPLLPLLLKIFFYQLKVPIWFFLLVLNKFKVIKINKITNIEIKEDKLKLQQFLLNNVN